MKIKYITGLLLSLSGYIIGMEQNKAELRKNNDNWFFEFSYTDKSLLGMANLEREKLYLEKLHKDKMSISPEDKRSKLQKINYKNIIRQRSDSL